MIDQSPDAGGTLAAANASIAPQQLILDHLLAETVRRARAKGERWTPQRSLLVGVLAISSRHLDADEVLIKAQAEEASMRQATVYRALNQLVDLGIAERHRLGSGPATFEITFGRPHHDHLVDITTGQTIEFRDPDIERL